MKRFLLVLALIVGSGVVFGGDSYAALPDFCTNPAAGGPPLDQRDEICADMAAANSERGCGQSFLGLKPWYEGLAGACEGDIKPPTCPSSGGCPEMEAFVWKIVLNLLFDLFVIVGYLAVGFVMFGGYTYLLARGDPGRIEKAKKTIIGAVSGLVIAIVASFVVSFISSNILGLG